jgi:hypothetical protein
LGKASNLLSSISKAKTIYIVTLDAETDEAIPDADVSLTVPSTFIATAPLRIKTLYTGDTAGVSLAAGASFTLQIDAKGYGNFSGQFKKNREDDEFLKCRLKKLKKITLTVPNGYVGPISYASSIPPTINNNAPTKKEYQLRVNASGEIEDVDSIQTSPDFYILPKSMCDGVVFVRYEDGREIPWAGAGGVTDSTIAMRPLKAPIPNAPPHPNGVIFDYTQSHISFVIGTAQDLKEASDKKPNADENEVKIHFEDNSPAP